MSWQKAAYPVLERSGRAVRRADAPADERFADDPLIAAGVRWRSYAGVRLTSQRASGTPVGGISLRGI